MDYAIEIEHMMMKRYNFFLVFEHYTIFDAIINWISNCSFKFCGRTHVHFVCLLTSFVYGFLRNFTVNYRILVIHVSWNRKMMIFDAYILSLFQIELPWWCEVMQSVFDYFWLKTPNNFFELIAIIIRQIKSKQLMLLCLLRNKKKEKKSFRCQQ